MSSLASIPEEHRAMVDTFTAFVRRELSPLSHELGIGHGDAAPDDVSRHVRRRSAALGFYAGEYPGRDGGHDMPLSVAVYLREAAERTGCALAPLALAGPEGPSPLLLAGTDEQRERYLRPLVTGEITRCFAVTEPETGSDAFAMRASARRDGRDWVLTGRKAFVSNADRADVSLVMARTGDGPDSIGVFIVERGTAGLRVGQRYEGMSGEPVFELILDEVRVGECALVGSVDAAAAGRAAGVESLSRGRLLVAGCAIGIAGYALDLAVDYARQRRAFGRAIGGFQHVQEHLVTSKLAVESARMITYACAQRADDGGLDPPDAALAKLAATEAARQVVDRALQVHGASGWLRGHPLEWLYRHVRSLSIIEGTTEIQKVIVARGLGLGGEEYR